MDFQGPIFRLRPEDWADFHVVSHVNQFGTLVDKCGKAKPFVFLVKHQDQLDEAVALVAGDADIKATLLFVLGFGAPLELIGKERESKVPLVDAAGKVSTRKVQCLSNHNTFDQSKVRVVVPVDKRPPVTTRETSKLDTLVIRLSLDKRFTDTKAWNKICQISRGCCSGLDEGTLPRFANLFCRTPGVGSCCLAPGVRIR